LTARRLKALRDVA